MHQSTWMLHPDYIPGKCSWVQMSWKGHLSDLTLKFYWMHWTHNKQLRSRYEVSSLPRLQTEILSVLQAITITIIEVNNQLQRKDNDIWSCLYTVSQCGRKFKFDQGFMKLNATFWTAVYMESLWDSCSATTVLQRKSNFTIIHLKVQWRVSCLTETSAVCEMLWFERYRHRVLTLEQIKCSLLTKSFAKLYQLVPLSLQSIQNLTVWIERTIQDLHTTDSSLNIQGKSVKECLLNNFLEGNSSKSASICPQQQGMLDKSAIKQGNCCTCCPPVHRSACSWVLPASNKMSGRSVEPSVAYEVGCRRRWEGRWFCANTKHV